VFWLAGWLQECLTTGSAESKPEFSHAGQSTDYERLPTGATKAGFSTDVAGKFGG